MKLHKLTKKQLVISAVSFAAALGIVLSAFADTAGGIATMHNKNTAAHPPVAAYEAAGAAAGNDAVNTGFRASALAADFVQPSAGSPSTSATSTDELSVPAGQPTTPPSGDSNDNSGDNQPPNPTPPQPPCPKCPVKQGGTMIACPEYCIQPYPGPGCQPCGGFRKTETNDAIMCPEMMCAYE